MENIKKYSWDINTITKDYESHSIETGSKKIRIAVIDSGVDDNHPGLKDNINNIINLVPNEKKSDITGHGTMVSGQIVGNSLIKGIVPNCKIDMIKVLDEKNKAPFPRLIKALEYVHKNNYHIVNLSVGVSTKNKDPKELNYALKLMERIYANNTICINAIGYNESCDMHFPSVSDYTLTVQSLGRDNLIVNSKFQAQYCLPSGNFMKTNLSEENDYDEYVTVFFPINQCLKLKESFPPIQNLPLGYIYSMGESLASAKFSGIVAAMLSRNLKINSSILNPQEVIKLLKQNSISINNRLYPNLLNILKDIK